MTDVVKIMPSSDAFLNHFYGRKCLVLSLIDEHTVGMDYSEEITLQEMVYMSEVFKIFLQDRIKGES